MTRIRSVPESDLDDFRYLHDRYVDREESIETVRDWYRERSELFVGAYRNGDLVGHCLGLPRSAASVELCGIGVAPPHRRRGIGTELLTAFEDRVASLEFERVTLGSAGGYVDEFYVRNGYSPESVLVRLDPDDSPDASRASEYEIVSSTIDDGVKKLYVAVDRFDPAFLAEVRDAFDDPEAIYVMDKRLDSPP